MPADIEVALRVLASAGSGASPEALAMAQAISQLLDDEAPRLHRGANAILRTAAAAMRPPEPAPAPTLPAARPMIISESATHIVVAIELPKRLLAGYRRFFDALLEAADGECA